MWCSMSAQLCPPLCDSMDCNLPGSSVHGIFQVKILEEENTFPSPGDLPNQAFESTYQTSPALAGGFFTIVPPGKLY